MCTMKTSSGQAGNGDRCRINQSAKVDDPDPYGDRCSLANSSSLSTDHNDGVDETLSSRTSVGDDTTGNDDTRVARKNPKGRYQRLSSMTSTRPVTSGDEWSDVSSRCSVVGSRMKVFVCRCSVMLVTLCLLLAVSAFAVWTVGRLSEVETRLRQLERQVGGSAGADQGRQRWRTIPNFDTEIEIGATLNDHIVRQRVSSFISLDVECF